MTALATTATPRPPLRALLPHGRDAVVVTLGAVALVLAAALRFGASVELAIGVVLCPVMILLAAIDLRQRLLPNELVLGGAGTVIAIVAIGAPDRFLDHLWAGLALFAFLFLFAVIFAGGLGMGDAKLGLLIGFALGAATAAAMFYALFAVFLAAGVILLRHGAAGRKQTLAFGPYLALGTLVAYFLG
jgi:prepilin signal peptidase PulO-like enzyme (type II secretory pathway)